MDSEDVDSCMQLGAGYPMGPLRLLDFIGLDVAAAIGQSLYADTGEERYRAPGMIEELIGEGRLGRKGGAGFYEVLRPLPGRASGPSTDLGSGALVLAGEIPDDVGLGDPLTPGRLGDRVPRKLGLGKVVPARQVQGLKRTRARPVPDAPRPEGRRAGPRVACR